MNSSAFFADVVLLIHSAIVLFVVGGLLLVWLGNAFMPRLQWTWVNTRCFRGLHLVAIGVVVAQSWLGMECPLTTLEHHLRLQAGQGGYQGSFIQHWVHQWMFFQAPAWVFVVAYTVFAAAVCWAWWRWPPVRR
ncbi:MAG TPA: DUF2784 domain-containing protein [Limnobacter sp.]|nr:DUF2784 domain-containing protein [Limnobacter sp.]